MDTILPNSNLLELQVYDEHHPAVILSAIGKLLKELRLNINSKKWYDTYVKCNNIKVKFHEQYFLQDEDFVIIKDIFISDIKDIILSIILLRLLELDDNLKLENSIQFNWHRDSVDETANKPIDQNDIGGLKNNLLNSKSDIIKIKLEEFNSVIYKPNGWYPISKYIQLKQDLKIMYNIDPSVENKIFINKNDYIFLELVDLKLSKLKQEMVNDKGHYVWHLTFSKQKQIAEKLNEHKIEIKEVLLQDKIIALERQIEKFGNNIIKQYMKSKIKSKNVIKESKEFISKYEVFIRNFVGSSKDTQYIKVQKALINLLTDLKQGKSKHETRQLIGTIENLLNILKQNANSNSTIPAAISIQPFSSIEFLNKFKTDPKPNKTIQYEKLKYEIEYFSILLEAFKHKFDANYQTKLTSNAKTNEFNYIIWSIEMLLSIGNYLITGNIDIEIKNDCIFNQINQQIIYASNFEENPEKQTIQPQEIETVSEKKSVENEMQSSIYGSLINLQTLQEEMSDIHSYLKQYNEFGLYNCDKVQYLKDLKSVENINRILIEDEQKKKMDFFNEIGEKNKSIRKRLEVFDGSKLEHEYYELYNDITFTIKELHGIQCKGCQLLEQKQTYLDDLLKELAESYDEKCANAILIEDERELKLDTIRSIEDRLAEIKNKILTGKNVDFEKLNYALIQITVDTDVVDGIEDDIIETAKENLKKDIEENSRLLLEKKSVVEI